MTDGCRCIGTCALVYMVSHGDSERNEACASMLACLRSSFYLFWCKFVRKGCRMDFGMRQKKNTSPIPRKKPSLVGFQIFCTSRQHKGFVLTSVEHSAYAHIDAYTFCGAHTR